MCERLIVTDSCPEEQIFSDFTGEEGTRDSREMERSFSETEKERIAAERQEDEEEKEQDEDKPEEEEKEKEEEQEEYCNEEDSESKL